ncbi:hypothetical protein V7183_14515 [Bacillus sp. JJ1127]|uniref:hypothetical protein n=1 Tax=Bacillus sp. JJ1127 TaxID=3122952 RepID=UPI003000DF51
MKNIKEKMYLFSFISVMTLNLVACDANKNEATVSKKFAAKNINEIHVKTIGQDIKLHSTSEKSIIVDTGEVKDAKIKEDGEKLEIITENSSSIL